MSLPRLQAPKEHGQILAIPPLDQAGQRLLDNRRALSEARLPGIDLSFSSLRTLVRREILDASAQYQRDAHQEVEERSSVEEIAARIEAPWIVAGHQPELFHPGVWFKNFALNGLARRTGATALNLVVDTDTARPALLHLPGDGRLVRVPYDRTSPETPYEERTVEDEKTFAAFPERVAAIASAWPFQPMLPDFWPEVMRQTSRTPLLGERFAAARRSFERRWGCMQREIPMSRVCRTRAFAWFATAVLERLSEFHSIYNQTVHAYRAAHHIRSRNHPVPDLTTAGEWREAPFWAWRPGGSRRGKLMVRTTPDTWHLRIGDDAGPSIPRGDHAASVDAWHNLDPLGFKVRSRALTTTMFLRLFVADLFIHGIGGGIYDELTDRIIERFFQLPPPGYLTLSATLLLPLPRYPEAEGHIRELDRMRRDLIYKPERFTTSAAAMPLLRAKAEWIARTCANHAERVERFHRLRAINARLSPFVMEIQQEVEKNRERTLREAALHAVAARRDYAFCLYPEEMLREFFQKTLK